LYCFVFLWNKVIPGKFWSCLVVPLVKSRFLCKNRIGNRLRSSKRVDFCSTRRQVLTVTAKIWGTIRKKFKCKSLDNWTEDPPLHCNYIVFLIAQVNPRGIPFRGTDPKPTHSWQPLQVWVVSRGNIKMSRLFKVWCINESLDVVHKPSSAKNFHGFELSGRGSTLYNKHTKFHIVCEVRDAVCPHCSVFCIGSYIFIQGPTPTLWHSVRSLAYMHQASEGPGRPRVP
jgi:hypothetical protein